MDYNFLLLLLITASAPLPVQSSRRRRSNALHDGNSSKIVLQCQQLNPEYWHKNPDIGNRGQAGYFCDPFYSNDSYSGEKTLLGIVTLIGYRFYTTKAYALLVKRMDPPQSSPKKGTCSNWVMIYFLIQKALVSLLNTMGPEFVSVYTLFTAPPLIVIVYLEVPEMLQSMYSVIYKTHDCCDRGTRRAKCHAFIALCVMVLW